MKNKFHSLINYFLGSQNRGSRKRVFSIIACVMAFITVYSLIIPAVAFDRSTAVRTAGTDAGGSYQLACTYDVHRHTEGCYERQPVYDADGNQTGTEKVLICGKEDYVVHEHDENCYETVTKTITENGKQKTVAEKKLVCTLPEIKEHKHTKECYIEEKVLTCGKTEQEAHKHSGKCYSEKKTIDCGKEEHGHSDKCYTEVVVSSEKVLQCGYQEGQEISPAVYSDPVTDDETGEVIEEAELIQEAVVHHHDDSCYQTVEKTEKQLTCGLTEHTHSDKCYKMSKELVCGKEETKGHKHSKSCYGKEKVLTCGKVELHTHTIDCYEKGPDNESPEKMGWVHYEKDADGNQILVGDPKHLICGKTELLAHQHDADCWVTEEEAAEIAEAKESAESAETEENTEAAKEADAEEADNWYQLDKEDTPQAATPDQGGETGTSEKDVESESADKDAGTETENAESGTVDENTEFESAGTAAEITVPVSGASYELHVSYDADSNIPEDAKFVAEAIAENDQAYDTYREKAVEAVDEKLDNETKAAQELLGLFDLTIYDAEENQIQPEAPINVTVDFGNEIDESNKEVYAVHFQGDGADGEVPADDAAAEVIDTDYTGDAAESVSFAAESLPVYAIVGTETLTEHVITANGESFTIEVTYGPDAEIPSGARLDAREILEGTEEYQSYIDQAREAMAMKSESGEGENITVPEGEDPKKADKNDEAVDSDEPISAARFFDINIFVGDEKIEPKAPVQVNIKYNDAIQLKDNELLKAIHFASNGTELVSVDVVESKEGITEVAFEQDSFSVTGTVVQYLSSGWPDNGDYVMIVKPYNSNNYYAVKNDGEITSIKYNANTGKVTFSDLTSVDQVDDYWWTKSNYSSNWKYLRAKNSPQNYLDPNESDALATYGDSVRRTTNGNIYNQTYSGWDTIYNYLLVNENSLKIEGQGSSNSANRAVVFFANDFEVDEVPEPTEDPTEVDLGAPGTGKTITSNNDGTYQLALSVTGKSQAQETHTTADVLVVFDTSGSMNSTRMSTAKSAMRTLANALLSNNTAENPDTVRLKLLPFASVTRSKTDNNPPTYYSDFAWVTGSGTGASFNNGYSVFNGQLGQLSDSGSGATNWEDALQDAADVSMRTDAAKYVIFVSDGNPTFRNTQGGEYNWQGRWQDWTDNNSTYQNRYDHRVYGTGSDTNATTVSHCYEMAKDDAKALVDAGINFYTIGVFGSVDRMNNLTAYAYSGSDSGSYPAGRYQAADADNIDAVFANIINDINKNFSYTDVEIDDGITALTATALVTGTVNNYEYKITYVDAVDNQTHTVSDATKNSDGTLTIPSVTYNIKNADGTTKSVTTTAVTVKGATYDGEKVTWELDKSDGTNYKLENGWTYEVSFTVWPTQRAYDLIADLANGNVTYASLSDEEKASIDQATLTLKTNSEASVTYCQITTTNGVDGTPSDPKTVGIDNPPGVPLAGSNLKIVKHWNDDLDPTQLLDILTEHLNAAGTDVDYTVTLDVKQDKGTSAEEDVHTADYPDGFVFKPTVTISGGKVTAATWPEIDIAVAPGIMMTYEHAHAHGFDTAKNPDGTPKYGTVTYNGITYYVIEKGHRYEITEREKDYHFEMESNVDHLMIIDGVLKNVIFNDAGTQIVEISQNVADLTELTATNSLKGGINLYKYVEDAKGNKITPKDDVFTVKCKLLDKNGQPYTRTSETVGDKESDGIVYRVIAPDAELETLYPGKVETGKNRTIKIGVLDSSEFTVQLKAGWCVRFINVPGNTTWEFEEIDIPDGYQIDTTGKETVDGHEVPKTRGMTGTVMANTANDAQITNTMEDFETRILKIEEGTGTIDPETGEYTTQPVKLEGVKFIVKNNNEGDDKDKYLVLQEGNITWDSTKTNAHVFTTNSEGVLSFGSLPLGKYLLTETETKSGYYLLTEDVSIEVTPEGVIYQVNSTAQPVKAGKKTVKEGEKTIIYSMIEVPNSAGVELPNTGGSGTLPYTLSGLALIMAAAMMYCVKMRRKGGDSLS